MRVSRPTARTPDRPTGGTPDPDRARFLQSYLIMRLVIGVIGILLPAAMVLGDLFVLTGEDFPRGSLSAYYHSGMRDVFVGSLCAIGIFLITYMVNHYNWDNVLSVVAGVAALGVALFPTGGGDPLTPLQQRLGEGLVEGIHFTCAAVFILSLAGISYLFGRREAARPDRNAAKRRFWGGFHKACAALIVGAVVGIALTKIFDVAAEKSLFYGETVAALSFGISWFMKGLELEWLTAKIPGGAGSAAST